MWISRYCYLLFYIFCLYLADAIKFYSIPYPDQILLEETSVVIGARNTVVRLDPDLTQVLTIKDLTPTEYEYNQCLTNGWPAEDCHNDVCIISRPTSSLEVTGSVRKQNDTIFICSSNAYSPECSYRDVNTFDVIHSFNGVRYISSDRQYQSSHLFTNDGNFYTYRQQGLGVDYVISKHTQPLSPDALVRTREYFNSQLWLNEADVVSMYEEGDFVYVFLREKAVEVTTRISQDEQVYGRVARICKNDLGSSPHGHFLSFQKARISCVYQQTSHTPAYHYNELQGTFKLSGAFDHSSTPFEQVYAVFSSPVNGPIGSAVCVYTFDQNDFDLVKSFRGRYIYEKSPYTWDTSAEKGDINCDANPIRTTEESRRNVIMQLSVKQAHDSSPLFYLNNQKFIKIAVDRVQALDGSYHEVMFILAFSHSSTIDIILHRVTYNPKRNLPSHLISSTTVVKDITDLYVTEMEIFRNENDQSKSGVLVGTKDGVYNIPLYDCSKYSSARSCVETMDPYCVFSCRTQLCVSIFQAQSDDVFLYNYTTGEVWTCPSHFTRIPTSSTQAPNVSTHSNDSLNHTTSSSIPRTDSTTQRPGVSTVGSLLPLPPISLEYALLGILLAASTFCVMGVFLTLCCLKLITCVKSKKKHCSLRTELGTLSSDGSSPTPKQFWEPAVLPYETPLPLLNNVFSQGSLNSYKPVHLQSSPIISAGLFSPLTPVNSRKFHASTIVSEPGPGVKFSSSTTPPLPMSTRPPLPPKRLPSQEYLLFATHPAYRPNSANNFKVNNSIRRQSHPRSYTPDSFLSDSSRSKVEI